MACAPRVTLVAISSRWSCMASQLQAGSTRAAPAPRSAMWLAENWGDVGNSLHPCPYSTTAGAAARDERAGLVDAPSGTHCPSEYLVKLQDLARRRIQF